MKFSIRVKDLEVRSCNDNLLSGGEHTKAVIVKWSRKASDEEYCYAVAKYDRGSEGFDLTFIGSRPFDCTDRLTFFNLAEQGQRLLDEFYYDRTEGLLT